MQHPAPTSTTNTPTVPEQFFTRIVMALIGVSGGLLLHPYQTMQSLSTDTWLVWLTLLPSGILACITIVWRLGVVPLASLLFPCSSAPVDLCAVLPFLSNVLTLFCLYWQAFLLYLLFRFSTAFKHAGE